MEKQSTDITINIKLLDNKTTPFHINKSLTISKLKDLIQQKLQIPIDKQRLIYRGRLLKDQETIELIGIENEHVIHCVAKKNEIPINQTTNQQQSQEQIPDNDLTSNDITLILQLFRTINQIQANRRNNQRRLLQQRINGFQRDSNKSLDVINQNIQTIKQMETCQIEGKAIKIRGQNSQNLQLFSYMNPFNFDKRKLFVGQWIDVKDTVNEWLEAQIINLRQNEVLVHYNGWNEMWDEWIQMSSDRIAPFRSYTVQQSNSLYMSPSPAFELDGNQNHIPKQKITIDDIIYELLDMMNHLTAMLFEYQQLQSKKMLEKINLEQEDKQSLSIQQQINLISSQVGPYMDRMGRLFIDTSSHFSEIGQDIQKLSQNQSRSIYKFQIPIMLTPGEILQSNSVDPELTITRTIITMQNQPNEQDNISSQQNIQSEQQQQHLSQQISQQQQQHPSQQQLNQSQPISLQIQSQSQQHGNLISSNQVTQQSKDDKKNDRISQEK